MLDEATLLSRQPCTAGCGYQRVPDNATSCCNQQHDQTLGKLRLPAERSACAHCDRHRRQAASCMPARRASCLCPRAKPSPWAPAWKRESRAPANSGRTCDPAPLTMWCVACPGACMCSRSWSWPARYACTPYRRSSGSTQPAARHKRKSGARCLSNMRRAPRHAAQSAAQLASREPIACYGGRGSTCCFAPHASTSTPHLPMERCHRPVSVAKGCRGYHRPRFARHMNITGP